MTSESCQNEKEELKSTAIRILEENGVKAINFNSIDVVKSGDYMYVQAIRKKDLDWYGKALQEAYKQFLEETNCCLYFPRRSFPR